MLAKQRQARILEEVQRSGWARVTDLTGLLGVSDMTVRRDLDQLASTGAVQKVHGGAVLPTTSTEEPGFLAKSGLQLPAKSAIAARAATLIKPGSAIAVSAGTTTWGLAEYVSSIPGLTIVTNSTTVADVIANAGNAAKDQVVILTGGMRTPSAALVGPVADAALRTLHVDQLFLGVHGMDTVAGFTTPNLAEAQTNRALINGANQIVVCADSTKWGSVGLASFAPLSAADVLITDDGLPDDARADLAEAVGTLHVVEVGRGAEVDTDRSEPVVAAAQA